MNQIILTASFLIPLILSVVILYNSKGNFPKQIMGWSMVNAAGVFIANYFYFLEEFRTYQYLHSIHVALVLFIYPSIYVYVLYLTQQKSKTSPIIHFVPGLFFLLLYIIFFDIKFSIPERINYLSTYRDNSLVTTDKYWLVNWIRMFNVAAIVGSVVLYSTSIIRLTGKYNQRLYTELSNAEEYRISWLNKANVALIVVAVVSVLFYVVNPFSIENDEFLILSMFVMSVFIWLMGIWGNAQKYIELPENVQDVNPALPDQEDTDLILKLQSIMTKEQVYKQSDLKLDDLARLAGTNRSYVSRAINQATGSNFNQFINQYRIEEAKKLLTDKKNKLKMNTVAIDAGFGSVSSFRRAFLKEVGTTPEKWNK